MHVERLPDTEAFRTAVWTFLLADEARHGLQLGLTARELQPDAYLAAVRRDDEVVACAVRTPPYGLSLTRVDDPLAVDAVAADVATVYDEMPWVLADPASARRFAAVWGEGHVLREERIYRCDAVVRPDGVSGSLRPAATADRDLLVTWMGDFLSDIGDEVAPGVEAAAMVDARLDDTVRAGMFVWTVGDHPVSLCGFTGPTPNGIRVAPVYTPPDRRGHGYASALTAAVTQHLLDAGRRFVTLFTDLANPTSNKIYQAVGYRPVADVTQLGLRRR